MNAHRIDVIAKHLATRRLSRRSMLRQGSAGFAAGALAAASLRATGAQEATPSEDPRSGASLAMLFFQSFRRGSITPKDGDADRFVLTLDQGLGQTIYFSDRPDRVVGALPTDEFLATLGFPDDDPPNAALVVEREPGRTDLAVLELFAPILDPASPGVTYEVVALAEWEQTLDLGFQEAPTDLARLGPTFGAAHLFIDSTNCIGQMFVLCFHSDSPLNVVGKLGWNLRRGQNNDPVCYNDQRYWCESCSQERQSQELQLLKGMCNDAYAMCAQKCDVRRVTSEERNRWNCNTGGEFCRQA